MTADFYPDSGAHEKWLSMVRLARRENVYLGFSAIYTLLEEEYPCPRSLKLLQKAVSAIGSEKVLWGSDIPSTLAGYTYRQMIDMIPLHTGFLREDEKDRIMGLNAQKFFEWN